MATLFDVGHQLTFVQNEDDSRGPGFSLPSTKVRVLFPGNNYSSRYQDRVKEIEDRVNEFKMDLDRELDAQIASTDVGSIIPPPHKIIETIKSLINVSFIICFCNHFILIN